MMAAFTIMHPFAFLNINKQEYATHAIPEVHVLVARCGLSVRIPQLILIYLYQP